MTKFQQNPLGGYGYIFVLLFTLGSNQNICDFGHIVLPNSRLTILPSLLIGKSGRLYIRMVVWSFVRHGRDSSDVTLSFEDAQGIQTLMDDG